MFGSACKIDKRCGNSTDLGETENILIQQDIYKFVIQYFVNNDFIICHSYIEKCKLWSSKLYFSNFYFRWRQRLPKRRDQRWVFELDDGSSQWQTGNANKAEQSSIWRQPVAQSQHSSKDTRGELLFTVDARSLANWRCWHSPLLCWHMYIEWRLTNSHLICIYRFQPLLASVGWVFVFAQCFWVTLNVKGFHNKIYFESLKLIIKILIYLRCNWFSSDIVLSEKFLFV